MINIHDWLSKDEIKMLTQRSDLKGAWEVFKTWAWIGGTLAVVGYFPSVFTIIPALFILGGKQLACAILMHDGSHRSLFKTHWLNDFCGNWLGGYMIVNDLHRYRPYHLKHHTNTGTFKDPDLSLTKGYPTTVISFMRKLGRDFSGITGLKAQLGTFAMNIGYIKYNLAGVVERLETKGNQTWNFLKSGFLNYYKPILANLALWGILWLCGAGWLYLLWLTALFTTFHFSLRIRSMAEHSVVPNPLDDHQNTRTTYANWLERLLFAPHHVNYHCEHHLLMTVPPYNLPKMHQIIKSRGFFDDGVLSLNYWEIIKLAMSKKQQMKS
jgi:fatty acid desaturase